MPETEKTRPNVVHAGTVVPLRAEVESAAGAAGGVPSGDLVLHLVRQCSLFQGLPHEGRVEAGCLASAWSVPRRTVLFREGDEAREFCLLYEGRVKLTQRTRNGEALVRVIGEGQACSWPGIFADQAYLATATALEPSHVLLWPRNALQDLFDRFPILQRSAMRVLSRRMREMQDRYRELATEHVPQRLARTLLRIVQPDGRRFEDGLSAEVPLSRRDLAQLSGTTLFTVSRLLGQWEEAGVLKSHRECVVVHDPQALGKLVDGRSRGRPHR